MKILITLALLVSTLTSAVVFATAKPVTVQCTFSEKKPGTPVNVVNPYGGGQNIQYTAADGTSITVTVMIDTNQDNQDLIDMQLLITGGSLGAMPIVTARGMSENKYKDNGLSVRVGSVGIKCAI